MLTRPTLCPPDTSPPRHALLPLGALAAGFGLAFSPAMAQTVEPASSSASAPAPTALPQIKVKAAAEPTGKDSYQATTTRIGKGNQELRDIPQSVTVVTQKLIEDRNLNTLKEVLHQTAGVSFLAAEGGEEDIRLRGFSLAASGDIFSDSLRDPAFYERDTFNNDRIELLRGSASMLFGRGSTGGVVNQVSKVPQLLNQNEVQITGGSGYFARVVGDFNTRTGEESAFRVAVMYTDADNYGNFIDKQGIAPSYRFGIGTADEFQIGFYYLHNRNGINYGMPWLQNGLVNVDPRNYYQAKSDYNESGATHGTLTHTHRFNGGGELRSALRHGSYVRDQRAGVNRFAAAGLQPGGVAVTQANLSDATVLTRGAQNKVQDMDTTYAQSDYSNKFGWFGLGHDVLTGVDLAHEQFNNYNMSTIATKPTTTIGTPNDSGSVDESLRVKRKAGDFDAKALGVYFQDTVQLAQAWKLIGGLRWDHFEGRYRTYQVSTTNPTPPPPLGTQTADRSRTDALWSKRFGVLFQPSDTASYHFSYGTSFNTQGDTYQYDAPGSNTGPEASRNIEVGGKLDFFDGRLSTRVAAFQSTKYNERNRDSDQGINQYLLSGARHASGLELDLSGKITAQWEVFGSYAWIPSASIDKAASVNGDRNGELQGARPSLTPRHSGTIWSTYQITRNWRFGGGLNARSSQTPNRNPVGIVAPHFITGDLMGEYRLEDIAFKLNVTNVTNKLYADSLYSGHYIPGAGRTVQLTMGLKF